MRPLDHADDLNAALAKLARKDRRLRPVRRITGALELRRRPGGFPGLARIIVGQQLSVAAAASIWDRLEAALPEVNAGDVQRAGDEALREAGLSIQKIRTLRAVAEAELDLDALDIADPEAAHASLTAIKGIGPWTADVYLMFCMGHPDIFPVGDIALRNAVAEAFGHEDGLTPAQLGEIAEAWSPWRTVAATLFWAYYSAMRAREGLPA